MNTKTMLARATLSLDGAWSFCHDADGSMAVDALEQTDGWREAQVPMPWQAQFDDLRLASGVGWYRRSFDAPHGAGEDTSAWLCFGAVDYHATVWLNGERIGEHEGGYLPFEFEVTENLRPGENVLVVRAADPTDDLARWPDSPFAEIPHGKQSWYGPIGGIWQGVRLETRPRLHLRGLRLTPDVRSGHLEIAPRFGEQAAREAERAAIQVRVEVIDPEGVQVAEESFAAAGLRQEAARIQFEPGSLRLWSVERPSLYRVIAYLLDGDDAIDRVEATCGFRTVEARDGRIYLNGEPIYLRGVLDQAYYPETIYTPPSLELLVDQAAKVKALGLNCLRCHIKVEDPRYYEVADRLGLLVWTEIPNWHLLTERSARRAKETFAGMVERDWNHPSIIIWTLVNENWGLDLVRDESHRRWLAEFVEEARAIDPTRLIVDNSACCDNFHVSGDIDDFHNYRVIPDHAGEWDAWVADFAGRAEWAWEPDYLENRLPGLPLIVSEFGNWGLPNPDRIQERGGEPWWFETGHERGENIVYPHGMRERFDYHGLGSVFGSFEAFIDAHQEHMARSLAYEIASMRLHPSIAGYVITEFTDVHWECNGLLDMQRNVKQGLSDHLVPINQDYALIARPERWSARPGERVEVELSAWGVDGRSREGTIYWQAGAHSGEIRAAGGVVEVPVDAAGILHFQAQWMESSGEMRGLAQAEIAGVESSASGTLTVTGDPELAEALGEVGYSVTDDMDPAVLFVTRSYSSAIEAHIRQGTRVLYLAGVDSPGHGAGDALAYVPLPFGHVVGRAGTPWQGDWATSFSWLKKERPFAHLPGGPLLGMEYIGLMPDTVIAGLPAYAFNDYAWAGLSVGWVHRTVALIARVPYGRGLCTVSTFKLSPYAIRHNAVAAGLLTGLVELAQGE